MKVNVMIKITDIHKQVITNDRYNIRHIFKEEIDKISKEAERVFGNAYYWTNSDFECFKDELEGRGIYVTWDAIGKFFGVEF